MNKSMLLFLITLFMFVSSAQASEEMYTYKRMKSDLHTFAETYQLQTKVIGMSEFGRKIFAVKVGQGPNSILITGSHHGREWLTTHVIMKMIREYASAYHKGINLYGKSTSIFDDVSIWFVPMVNPDGVAIQQQGIDHFPFLLQEVYVDMNEGKGDFSRWKANGLGVDLNRQYPAGWEVIKGNKKYAAYSHYKGHKPFEANETKALYQFTEKIQPLAAASYHTSGRVIYWYYYNKLENLWRDYALVEELSKTTGYEIDYPPSNAIGGGYTDWFVNYYEKPAVTLELSYPVEDTNPPLSVLDEEWKRNKEVGLIMAHYAAEKFLMEKNKRDPSWTN